jgi:hypothetical protein
MNTLIREKFKTNNIYPMNTLIREKFTYKSIKSTFISLKSTIGTLLHGVTHFGSGFSDTTNSDLAAERASSRQSFSFRILDFCIRVDRKGNRSSRVCGKRLSMEEEEEEEKSSRKRCFARQLWFRFVLFLSQ